jgi:hypothetical protein
MDTSDPGQPVELPVDPTMSGKLPYPVYDVNAGDSAQGH